MATKRFSLAPPTKGNNIFKAIDIIGVPDLEWIRKFSDGNVGISESLFNDFMEKSLAGLEGETREIFENLSNKNNTTDSWGMPGVEKTIVKSVFETQKPYIDVVLSTLDTLTTVEDIIAVLLGGSNTRSLKPKTNKKSLYAKLNGIKNELSNINQYTSPSFNSLENISLSEKLTGISDLELSNAYSKKERSVIDGNVDGEWEVLSTVYSTGDFIPGIPYNYIYRNITDESELPPEEDYEVPEPEIEDKPPVMIFDIYVDKYGDGKNIEKVTNPNMLPNDWDISSKWFGQWSGWSKDRQVFINEFESHTDELISDELAKQGIEETDIINQVKGIYKNAMPNTSDLYDQLTIGNFKSVTKLELDNDTNRTYYKRKYKDNGVGFGDYVKDNIADEWDKEDTFGYKPRKINNMWINPEADYDLRLVRVFPENSRYRPNGTRNITNVNVTNNTDELSGSNPLVYNYGDDIEISDGLDQYVYDENHDITYINPIPKTAIPSGINNMESSEFSENNNYVITKEKRSYFNNENHNRTILDKIRKSNTRVTEKLVVGTYDPTFDLFRIVDDLEFESKNDVIIKRHIDNVLLLGNYDSVTHRNSYSFIIDYIYRSLRTSLDRNHFENRESFIRNLIVKSLKESVNNGLQSLKNNLNSNLNGFLVSVNSAERKVVEEIKKPEVLYGEYENKNIWKKKQYLSGATFNTTNITNNNGNITINIPSNSAEFKPGDFLDDVTFIYVGEGHYNDSSPSNNDTLKETKFIDKGIFYIVEGIYTERKDLVDNKLRESGVSTTPPYLGDERYYKFGKQSVRRIRSIIKAISKFAKFASTVLVKIIKSSINAFQILKNPFNFIFELIMENMSDNFAAFDPGILSKFQTLGTLSGDDLRTFIEEDPTLRNFIALDLEDNYRFIFDGAGIMSLFGFNFGVNIQKLLPQLILENNGLGALFCSEPPPDRGKDMTGKYEPNGNLVNTEANSSLLDTISNRKIDLGEGGYTYEVINIEYSTGDFVQGLNYTYYYITLDNESLINKANNLIRRADEVDNKAEQIRLKMEALKEVQKALVKDPSNSYLNSLQEDLIKENGVQTNILLQFFINIIVLPIKIVICIIEYIIDFFTSLKVTELPSKIPEFLSFQWILDFFKPTKILLLLGMEINPDYSLLWFADSLVKNSKFKSIDNISDIDFGIIANSLSSYKYDVSKILSAPFLGIMPMFDAQQLPHTIFGGNKHLLNMASIFKFLEMLINEILCFLFNIFNLDKLFPCPTINLSKYADPSLSKSDIEKMLMEDDDKIGKAVDLMNNSEDYLYDITLENGEKIEGLTKLEVESYVAENPELRYKYSFGISSSV